MARNRKRAKERRDRRPQPVASRSRVAAGQGEVGRGMPSPIEHATPDVKLADAQLAMGRAEAAPNGEPLSDAELYAAELQDEELTASADGGGGVPPDGGGALALPGPTGVPEPQAAGVPEPRPRPRARLIGFLEGS